ncbi:MAG TPA: trypsin-like serine protease [Puia sp.]|nr:trypsin-like serine protease [Puia sp.]
MQIQNFDNDYRQGEISRGYIVIGTLGCMVRLETGQIALLSNNHVIAGENKGLKSQDRILQPGSLHHNSTDQIATLSDFIDLQVSQPGATPRKGGILYNEIDAGLAQLDPSIQLTQGYLPFRKLISPGSSASAKLGDQVFKVGRTTGLTYGTVIDIATIVGPIPYPSGACWFRDSIVVEGLNGTQFSDKGDSGSAILRTNGEVIGILYAGNGQQTYVCPIDTVLNELKCKIA